MNTKRQWIFALVALAALAAVAAAPAGAVPPVMYVVDGGVWVEDICGFPITHTDTGTAKITVFFDANGNPVKAIATDTSHFTETFTNEANGKTLVSNSPVVQIIDFGTKTLTEVGLVVGLHVPGEGLILLGVGKLVFDLASGQVVYERGPHWPVEGNIGAYCSYFAR
jgi:hypothetical protein